MRSKAAVERLAAREPKRVGEPAALRVEEMAAMYRPARCGRRERTMFSTSGSSGMGSIVEELKNARDPTASILAAERVPSNGGKKTIAR